MASVKNLKKDIHNTLGDLIELCYIWELENPEAGNKKSQKIIDETLVTFDKLMDKLHDKAAEKKSDNYKVVQKELEVEAQKIIEKINKLK